MFGIHCYTKAAFLKKIRSNDPHLRNSTPPHDHLSTVKSFWMQLFVWVAFCPITTMLLVNRAILVKVSFGERLLTCMHEERYHLSVVIKKINRIYCDYEIGQRTGCIGNNECNYSSIKFLWYFCATFSIKLVFRSYFQFAIAIIIIGTHSLLKTLLSHEWQFNEYMCICRKWHELWCHTSAVPRERLAGHSIHWRNRMGEISFLFYLCARA